jgi:hypothetical protein
LIKACNEARADKAAHKPLESFGFSIMT